MIASRTIVFVDRQKIEMRTIKVDNADAVGQISDNDIFTAPANLDIWNPSNGSLVTITGAVDDIVHSGTINSDYYEASNSIISTATIGNNQNVVYEAGNFICLNDVFLADADNGVAFLAYVDIDCLVTDDNGASSSDEDNTPPPHPKIDESDAKVILKNYPNPFTGHTTIEFKLLKDTPVTLSVSDATGREVEVFLNNEVKAEGTHLITFDGNNYPAGMYYYTIQAGEYVGTQKMVLMK